MKTIALLLAVMLPSSVLAQQKPRLLPSPAFEHGLQGVAPKPLYERVEFWAATTGFIAVLAVAVAVGFAMTAPPARGVGLTQPDFPCNQAGMMCDGWINKPSS